MDKTSPLAVDTFCCLSCAFRQSGLFLLEYPLIHALRFHLQALRRTSWRLLLRRWKKRPARMFSLNSRYVFWSYCRGCGSLSFGGDKMAHWDNAFAETYLSYLKTSSSRSYDYVCSLKHFPFLSPRQAIDYMASTLKPRAYGQRKSKVEETLEALAGVILAHVPVSGLSARVEVLTTPPIRVCWTGYL